MMLGDIRRYLILASKLLYDESALSRSYAIINVMCGRWVTKSHVGISEQVFWVQNINLLFCLF